MATACVESCLHKLKSNLTNFEWNFLLKAIPPIFHSMRRLKRYSWSKFVNRLRSYWKEVQAGADWNIFNLNIWRCGVKSAMEKFVILHRPRKVRSYTQTKGRSSATKLKLRADLTLLLHLIPVPTKSPMSFSGKAFYHVGWRLSRRFRVVNGKRTLMTAMNGTIEGSPEKARVSAWKLHVVAIVGWKLPTQKHFNLCDTIKISIYTFSLPPARKLLNY